MTNAEIKDRINVLREKETAGTLEIDNLNELLSLYRMQAKRSKYVLTAKCNNCNVTFTEDIRSEQAIFMTSIWHNCLTDLPAEKKGCKSLSLAKVTKREAFELQDDETWKLVYAEEGEKK